MSSQQQWGSAGTGALGGAGAGAVIGTAIAPGLGTIIGAGGGALLGGAAGFMSAGGGGGRRASKAMKEFAKAQKRAYEENLRRYYQVLGEMDELYERQMGQFDPRGEAQRRGLTQSAQRSRAAMAQDLASRGMGSSTLAQVSRAGADRQLSTDLVSLRDTLAREKMDLDRSLSQARQAFIAGRQDVGPDPNMLALQLQMAGQPTSGQLLGGDMMGMLGNLAQMAPMISQMGGFEGIQGMFGGGASGGGVQPQSAPMDSVLSQRLYGNQQAASPSPWQSPYAYGPTPTNQMWH